MWLSSKKRIIQRTLGALLICFSLTVVGVWFLWLVPYVSRFDPRWSEQFTRKGYWDAVQKSIRRYGWTHDDFFVVGNYGDKAWAEWIMGKATAGQRIADCGNIGHKDEALRYITCNDPASGREADTQARWLDWWSTNKAKSQLDWIKAGLENYGVSVHIPPSEVDTEPLLALLGNTKTNENEKIPAFVKYNAFRWLRDGGFQPIPFALTNVTAGTSAVLREGLLKYDRLDHLYPRFDDIGRLAFADSPQDLSSGYKLPFYSPAIQITGYSLMTIPLLLGLALLLHARRSRKVLEVG